MAVEGLVAMPTSSTAKMPTSAPIVDERTVCEVALEPEVPAAANAMDAPMPRPRIAPDTEEEPRHSLGSTIREVVFGCLEGSP